MVWDYAENFFQLLADLAALVLCLFYYISNKRRVWMYGILFFLSTLLSIYYWTAYLILMDSWPTVSDLIAYTGWDLGYLFLLVLVQHIKSPEEKRYFHPLMLIAVPLDIILLLVYLYSPTSDNAVQLTTSIHSGYLWNNLYLIIVCNLIGISSLQSLGWRLKKRDRNMPPWIPLAGVLLVVFGFAMLIFSNLYGPVSFLYYPSSFLCSLAYLFLVWAVNRSVPREEREELTPFDRKLRNILKASSLGIVLVFLFGGLLLGLWIRNTITRQAGPASGSGASDIIPVVLFVISVILIVFVVAVILVVYFSQQAAENSKLKEARQVAERSSAAKSEFLAAMSHEIRTPINAVLGMNEIVLRESRQARERLPDSPEDIRGVFGDISGYAGVIDSAGKNLLSIINDILDISRIEAGKMEIREDGYLLSSVLSDVCNLIRIRAGSRNLDFRVNVEQRIPDSLFGDAVRVRQIMLNILNNAVKYTGRGSVTLSVYSGEDTVFEDGRPIRLIVSVLDTGVGIRKEDRDKLFSKFERIGLAETKDVEGSGLGLTIVKKLLDMMGGTIRVESRYGEGSIFTVSIPQKIVSAAPIGNFRERFENSAGSAEVPRELFRAPSARILVVDDTRMNLAVVEGLLKGTAMRIDTAPGGQEALRRTLSVPYDLILMDQRMPGMDGIEALRRIRAQEGGANRETPVICLTADAIAGAKNRYLAEGFTDYLSKPIDSAELRKKLAACLPAEKVIPLSGGEAGGPAEAVPSGKADNPFPGLRPDEIDVVKGMAYCQQDRELYRSLLAEFAGEAPGRAERMEKSFASWAWKDYGILVHSLKSISATIGAARLSEAAAAMEAAAKREDTEALRRGHVPLLILYRQVAEDLQAFRAEGDSAPADSDMVFEFMPEE